MTKCQKFTMPRNVDTGPAREPERERVLVAEQGKP